MTGGLDGDERAGDEVTGFSGFIPSARNPSNSPHGNLVAVRNRYGQNKLLLNL